MAAALFALVLAMALFAHDAAVSGKRLCHNENVHLDFGPDESFIASFSGGGGGGSGWVDAVFVRDIGTCNY